MKKTKYVAIDLSKTIKEYRKKTGWIAIDENNDIVVWAKNFSEIMDLIGDNDLVAFPLSNDYSGLVTKLG